MQQGYWAPRPGRGAVRQHGRPRPADSAPAGQPLAPPCVARGQPRAPLAQLQAYSEASDRRPAAPGCSGRKVWIVAAVWSVVVRPSARPRTAASAAPGCGPWVKPEGCSVIDPTPTPEPLRAAEWPAT